MPSVRLPVYHVIMLCATSLAALCIEEGESISSRIADVRGEEVRSASAQCEKKRMIPGCALGAANVERVYSMP